MRHARILSRATAGDQGPLRWAGSPFCGGESRWVGLHVTDGTEGCKGERETGWLIGQRWEEGGRRDLNRSRYQSVLKEGGTMRRQARQGGLRHKQEVIVSVPG